MPLSTIKLLEDFAGYCAVKNKVIAQNIANVGTENYKRQDVFFKEVLDENTNSLLKKSDGSYIENNNADSMPKCEIVTDNSQDKVSGVNNVDIDKEMADLAENNLNFSFAAQKIGDYFKKIDSVIQGNPV